MTPDEEQEFAILESAVNLNKVLIQDLQNQIHQLEQKFMAHRDRGKWKCLMIGYHKELLIG